jgi:hypothetical protein
MSNDDIEEKFIGLVSKVLGQEKTVNLLKLAWSVSSLDDVSEICRASAP